MTVGVLPTAFSAGGFPKEESVPPLLRVLPGAQPLPAPPDWRFTRSGKR